MCVRESSKTLNHADCLTAQRRRAPPAAPPALPSVPCCHESHSPTATGPRRRRRIRRRRRRGARRESSKTRRVSVVVLRRTTNNYTNNYTHAACHTFLATSRRSGGLIFTEYFCRGTVLRVPDRKGSPAVSCGSTRQVRVGEKRGEPFASTLFSSWRVGIVSHR